MQIPDEVIDALMALLQEDDDNRWAMGRFIQEITEEFPQVERSELIRQMADRSGADRSTLRDRHNMARFFTPLDVVEYEVLSYSQLRACKSAGAEKWREYADWALENMPAPVAVIRAKIKANGDDPPTWVYHWDRFQRLAGRLLYIDGMPEEIKALACVIIEFDYPLEIRSKQDQGGR